MMYVRWSLLVFVDVFMTLLNLVLAPFLVLLASRDGWLPGWLSIFQTPDNSLDGDIGWKTEHVQWRFDLPPILATYVGRVGWLWRNGVYGFSFTVIGARTQPSDVLVTYGDPLTSDRPIHSGYLYRVLLRDGKPIYWQYYFVARYSATRCIRINIGWKLHAFRPGEAVRCQFVFNPRIASGLSEA